MLWQCWVNGVGLHKLKCLFQGKWFCDSVILYSNKIRSFLAKWFKMAQAWLVTLAELEFADMRQKIINFLTKEELEATSSRHLWATQFKAGTLSGHPQTTLLWGGKRKGPVSDKKCMFARDTSESLSGGSSQCGTVNFYVLELHLLLAWAAQPLACYQALQENVVSETAPGKTEQTLSIRRKTNKQKNPS